MITWRWESEWRPSSGHGSATNTPELSTTAAPDGKSHAALAQSFMLERWSFFIREPCRHGYTYLRRTAKIEKTHLKAFHRAFDVLHFINMWERRPPHPLVLFRLFWSSPPVTLSEQFESSRALKVIGFREWFRAGSGKNESRKVHYSSWILFTLKFSIYGVLISSHSRRLLYRLETHIYRAFWFLELPCFPVLV